MHSVYYIVFCRLGYQSLLGEVEEGMRSVIVTASNYDELKLIHTIRRLYQRSPTGDFTVHVPLVIVLTFVN